MGVIDETAQWAVSVYQIEAGDPANGGPDAPDNVQARALADRTLYLKNEIEALEATVAAIDLSGYLETADLLDAVKAVDGAGSGIDADRLDGLHAGQFLRSDQGDTMTGTLTVERLTTPVVRGTGNELVLAAGEFSNHLINNATGEWLYLCGDNGVKAVSSPDDLASGWWGRHEATLLDTQGNTYFPGQISSNGNAVWHAGNDGAASGLDADLLDGLHAASFVRTDDLLNAVKAVDGAGSGIDADLLDGLHAGQFLRSDQSDTMTGILTVERLTTAVVRGTGNELVLAAGEFSNYVSDNATGEWLYLCGDNGVKAVSSPDDLASGWWGRHEATLLDTQGNTYFPGRVYIAGGQTWQQVQRSHNVLYMNTTGTAIAVAASLNDGVVFQVWDGSQYTYSWTSDVDQDQGSFGGEITIPNGWGYRIGGSGGGHTVWELR
jgi:hypothetical protein